MSEPLTPTEIDQLDPQAVDSITADRMIATIRYLQEQAGVYLTSFLHLKAALWVAREHGELTVAAEWAIEDVPCWLSDDEIANDPWAHDWRKYWRSRRDGRPTPPCMICGDPSVITGNGMAACSRRHVAAVRGDLPDEQCRVCGKTTVCAYEAQTSGPATHPVCADCWPGRRIVEEARAAWRARFATTGEAS